MTPRADLRIGWQPVVWIDRESLGALDGAEMVSDTGGIAPLQGAARCDDASTNRVGDLLTADHSQSGPAQLHLVSNESVATANRNFARCEVRLHFQVPANRKIRLLVEQDIRRSSVLTKAHRPRQRFAAGYGIHSWDVLELGQQHQARTDPDAKRELPTAQYSCAIPAIAQSEKGALQAQGRTHRTDTVVPARPARLEQKHESVTDYTFDRRPVGDRDIGSRAVECLQEFDCRFRLDSSRQVGEPAQLTNQNRCTCTRAVSRLRRHRI